MTKNALIKKLQKIPGNPKIICSCDAEGNSFNELHEVSPDLYWDDHINDLLDSEELEDVEKKNYKKCVVLWPS